MYWLIGICAHIFDWYQNDDLGWPWRAIIHSVTLCACLLVAITKIWMKIAPYLQRRKCSAENLLCNGYADICEGSLDRGHQMSVENCDYFFLRSLYLTKVRIWDQNYVWVCSPPMAFHWHQNRWPWMALNSHFVLNTVKILFSWWNRLARMLQF